MDDLFDNNGATFSDCRKYRYELHRIWDESKPLVMIIGLNPSKGDENRDDNTIQKVKKVAAHNGYGGFYIAIVEDENEVKETLIVGEEISSDEAIGKDVVIINRKPRPIIGTAPKNIIDKLISGKKKDGDEVEVEIVRKDEIIKTEYPKYDRPLKGGDIMMSVTGRTYGVPKLNDDGTVICK